MPIVKSKKEHQLQGTYRRDQHGHLDYEIKGDQITDIEPARGWRKNAKEQFNFLTHNLIKFEMLQVQDIPSLYMLGDYLNELDYIKTELKKAKKEKDTDLIFKYQNQYTKLVRAFTELAQKYYITPNARNKALANMVRANENQKLNKALELIANGKL